MLSNQPVKAAIAAILWIVLAAIISTNARGQALGQGQESSVRAATLRYNWQIEACRALPGPGERAVCSAKASASWKIALALAEARRADTPAAWRKANKEIKAEEERILRVAAAARR